MIIPILDRRTLTVVAALQELPESHAGHLDVVVIANDEVHGDIQGVLNIMIEGDVRQEGKLEQTGSVLVRIRPDMLESRSH